MKAKAKQSLLGVSVLLASASGRRLEHNSNSDSDVWLNLMHDDTESTYDSHSEQSQVWQNLMTTGTGGANEFSMSFGYFD